MSQNPAWKLTKLSTIRPTAEKGKDIESQISSIKLLLKSISFSTISLYNSIFIWWSPRACNYLPVIFSETTSFKMA